MMTWVVGIIMLPIGVFVGLTLAVLARRYMFKRLLGAIPSKTPVFLEKSTPWLEEDVKKTIPSYLTTITDSYRELTNYATDYMDLPEINGQDMIEEVFLNIAYHHWLLFYILRHYAENTQPKEVTNHPTFRDFWYNKNTGK